MAIYHTHSCVLGWVTALSDGFKACLNSSATTLATCFVRTVCAVCCCGTCELLAGPLEQTNRPPLAANSGSTQVWNGKCGQSERIDWI